MKRSLDIVFSLALAFVTLPLWLLAATLVRLGSPGPILHRSRRVGRDDEIFTMYKFRTMHAGTPQLASHLLAAPASHLVPGGAFLRRTSIDELPQLLNVLRGEMSLVGPRPALFNQQDLIAARRRNGASALRPGITGWAQINGRDELGTDAKAAFDGEYAMQRSLAVDLRILRVTFCKALCGQGVSH